MIERLEGVRPLTIAPPPCEPSPLTSTPLSGLTNRQKEDLAEAIELMTKVFQALTKLINKANRADEERSAEELNEALKNLLGGHKKGPKGTKGPKGSKPATPANAAFHAGPNPDIGKWSSQIKDAAAAAGLDPNLVAAMTWAASRGNPNAATRHADGTVDKGLMKMSPERWKRDVVPKLTGEERAKIKEATGLEAEQLDMSNPLHNLIAGSFGLKKNLECAGGDLEKALTQCASEHHGDGDTFAKNVLQHVKELRSGSKLSDNPHGSP